MRQIATAALLASLLGLTACTTTDAVSLPFDLASTTGDAASSASSSSGGDDDGTQARLDQERYVNAQIDWIARDAARGEGENLAALAALLGETDEAAFSLWAHNNYALLFSELQHPSELLSRIAQHRQL